MSEHLSVNKPPPSIADKALTPIRIVQPGTPLGSPRLEEQIRLDLSTISTLQGELRELNERIPEGITAIADLATSTLVPDVPGGPFMGSTGLGMMLGRSLHKGSIQPLVDDAELQQRRAEFDADLLLAQSILDSVYWLGLKVRTYNSLSTWLQNDPNLDIATLLDMVSPVDIAMPVGLKNDLMAALEMAKEDRIEHVAEGEEFLRLLVDPRGNLNDLLAIDATNMTSNELVDALVAAGSFQAPEGLTAQQAREMFIRMGSTAEQADARVFDTAKESIRFLEEIRQYNAQHAALWDEASRIQSGEIISAVRKAMYVRALTQPGMMLLQPAIWWSEKFLEPGLAHILRKGLIVNPGAFFDDPNAAIEDLALVIPRTGILGETLKKAVADIKPRTARELEELFVEAQNEGKGYWAANQVAWEDWDTNWFNKFSLLVFADPFTYFGFGLYGRGVGLVYPRLGRGIGMIEKGYVAIAEYPFNKAHLAMRKITPRTFIQKGRIHASHAIALLERAYASAGLGRNLYSATPESIRLWGRAAIQHAVKNPQGADLLSRAGRAMLGFRVLHEGDLDRLLLDLVPHTVTPIKINKKMLEGISYIMDTTDGFGITRFLEPEPAATAILAKIPGVAPSEAAHKVTVNWLRTEMSTMRRAALAMLDVNDVEKQLIGMSDYIAESFRSAARSTVSIERYQSGLVGGMLSGLDVASRRIFIDGLDKFATQPFARAYLVFAAYGPQNVNEAAIKSLFAGVNPITKGDRYVRTRSYFHNAPEGIELPLNILFPQELNLGMGYPTAELRQLATATGRRNTKSLGLVESYVAAFNAGKTLEALGGFLKWGTGTSLGNRTTNALYANYALGMTQRMMRERIPRWIQARGKYLDDVTQDFEQFMQKDVANAYREMFAMRMETQDGRFVLNTPKDFHPGKVIRGEAVKVTERFTQLPEDIVATTLNMAEDGSLWAAGQMDQLRLESTQRIMQHYYSIPGVFEENFGKLVEGILNRPATNALELNQKLNIIHNTIETFQDGLSTVLNVAVHEAHMMTDPFDSTAHINYIWRTKIIPQVNSVTRGIDDAVEAMRVDLRDPDFTDTLSIGKRDLYESLMTALQKRSQLFSRARKEYDSVRSRFMDKNGQDYIPENKRDNRWWNNFLANTRQPWDDAFAELNTTGADLLRLQATITDELIPPLTNVLLRPAGRNKLNRLDIANLYGVHAGDLERSMYMSEMQAIKPRGTFIANTMNRAKFSAKQTSQQPEDFGWSDDAVGVMYDQMVRKMVENPRVQKGIEPLSLEFEGMMSELTALGVRKNSIISPEGLDAVERAAQRIYNEIYAPTKVDVGETVKVTFKKPQLALPDLGNGAAQQELLRASTVQIESITRQAADDLADALITFRAKVNPNQAERRMAQLKKYVSNNNIISRTSFENAANLLKIYQDLIGKGQSKAIRQNRREAWNRFVEDGLARIDVAVPSEVSSQLRDRLREDFILGTRGSALPPSKYPTPTDRDLFVGDRGMRVRMETPAEQRAAFQAAEEGVARAPTVEELSLLGRPDDLLENQATFIATTPAGDKLRFSAFMDEAPLEEGIVQLDVERIVPAWEEKINIHTPVPKGTFNQSEMREILRLIAGQFPEADYIQGQRLTGAKAINKAKKDIQRVSIKTLGPQKKITLEQYGSVIDDSPGYEPLEYTRERIFEFRDATGSLDGDEIIDIVRAVNTPEFTAVRASALQEMTLRRRLDFPDYENQTAISALMKQIYPFWGYESHRFGFWLPREFARHPGTFAAWGKYQDNTDNGYIHIPGTSLDINPIRGTIFMGGFRRLSMRDYPEFYDNFAGFAEIADYGSRFGFYPGFPIGAVLAVYGPKSGKSQFGELLPPIARTLLSSITALAPKSGPLLNDIVFPDRFRDYLIALEVTRLDINKEHGISGTQLLKKRLLGEEFTAEETAIWERATRGISAWQVLFEQTGLFRFNPQERIELRKLANIIISEITGIPVDNLEDMRRFGIRLEDVMGPMPPNMIEALNQLEQWRRFSGASVVLLPSQEGKARALVTEFWQTYAEQMAIERDLLLELEQQYRVNPTEGTYAAWVAQLRVKGTAASRIIANLKALPLFENVPVTIDERRAFANETGIKIFFHPAEELRELYFSFELEQKWDEELGRMVDDFDGLFAHRDVIENSMSAEENQDFQEWARQNSTPLEQLKYVITRDYLRPYQLIYDAVLNTFSAEERSIIRRSREASGDKRSELRAEKTEGGDLIVADFEGQLRTARKNMRTFDPQLDAWLLFFRKTSRAASEEGNAIFNQIENQFRLQGAESLLP
jgi:hypothetical protein